MVEATGQNSVIILESVMSNNNFVSRTGCKVTTSNNGRSVYLTLSMDSPRDERYAQLRLTVGEVYTLLDNLEDALHDALYPEEEEQW